MPETHGVNNSGRIIGKFSPARSLVITLGGIILAEVIAMVVILPVRHWPYIFQVAVDASVMAIIIFPLLFFFSLKPLIQHIQLKHQADLISRARLRLIDYSYSHTLDELLQSSLDEIELLTGSSIGFFHFLHEDQRTILLQAWSTNTLKNMCNAKGKGTHYDIDQAGVWADCVRLRKAVIHNDYLALPDKRGLPEGHARLIREMAVPIIRDDKIQAIIGVGNKLTDYKSGDVEIILTIADFVWDIVEYKKSIYDLRESEEKFHTFVDWTYDWEKWIDPQGNVVYMSPSCERISGYSQAEFFENPELLTQIVHPLDKKTYIEHQQVLHNQDVGLTTTEYRIIDRKGNEHWIEHVCRPLFRQDGCYLGRRVSNRDVTQRKNDEEEIRNRSQREVILNQTIQTLQTDIARDLHDTLGQNISFLRMSLEFLAESGLDDRSVAIPRLKSMTQAANESYEIIRSMLTVLKLDESSDILLFFSRYAEQVAERGFFRVEISSEGKPGYLSPQSIRQLFFTFREIMNNIEKHAAASQVIIKFSWTRSKLTLSIVDDGKGFDQDQHQTGEHYGIKFMHERLQLLHGKFSIKSKPGQGTIVQLSIPISGQNEPSRTAPSP